MIIDTNVVVAAVLGRSLPLLRAVVSRGIDLFITAEQLREVNLVTATHARRHGRDLSRQLQESFELLVPVEAGYYAWREDDARSRLSSAERAQKDWPMLALAIVTGDAVWTNDVDLFGTGVATWRTLNIHFAQPPLRQQNSSEIFDA